MARIKITALGSSFAAGPGIEPMEDRNASRSMHNYAHRLAAKVGGDLTDLTVSSATLLNVLNEPQYIGARQFAPQLSSLSSDADIVTMTCGGNDLGYIGCITHDSLMTYLGGPRNAAMNLPTAPFLDLHDLTTRLRSVLDRIHELAPCAKVYLVDVALTTQQMEHYNGVASLLSQAYREAAKDLAWVEVVPVSETSKRHALGSKEPWIDGFNLSMLDRGRQVYHPNLAGHTAIAKMLYERIRAERVIA